MSPGVLHNRVREHLVGLGLGVLGVAVLFRQLLFIDSSKVLWGDDFDTRLLQWIFEWGYQALAVDHSWSAFFNANSFYPHANTLAYSDALLSAQVLYTPLRWLGVEGLTALYLSLAGVTVIGCVLTNAALLRVGLTSAVERAIIVWLAHFGLGVVTFLGHYQLFGFQLVPACLIFAFLAVTRADGVALLVASALYLLALTWAAYVGPMVLVVGALALGPVGAWSLSVPATRGRYCQLVVPALASLALAALVYAAYLRPYLAVAREFPKQSMLETAVYAADPNSFFRGKSLISNWYAPTRYGNGDWERAFFPGYVTLVLVIAGLVVLAVAGLRWSKARRPLSPFALFVVFSLLIFVCAQALALGPFIRRDPAWRLPFFYLAMVFPGLDSVRAPGRFGMLLGFPMGVLIVVLKRGVESIAPKAGTAVCVIALCVVMVESLPRHRVFPVPYANEAAYQQVARVIPRGAVVIDLPLAGSNHIDSLKRLMAQLNGSLVYRGKLFVGYGAKQTSEYDRLMYLSRIFGEQPETLDQLVAFATGEHADFIVLRKRDVLHDNAQALRDALAASLPVVTESDEVLVVRVPAGATP